MSRGVILYGPPAAGKDTITAQLTALDPAYQLFPRLKAGPGRTTGYRMTTHTALDQLARDGGVVWENQRYSARYVLDQPELLRRLTRQIPVVHLGQVAAVNAVKAASPDSDWLVVWLWCDRHEAVRRIEARATGDDADRLRAWDETEPLPDADLRIHTGTTSAADAARTIRDAMQRSPAT